MGHPTGSSVDVREHPGRRRDATRDAAIVAATLDLLVEVGYDRLTMEAVAGRAQAGKATLYRRWSSKAELVVDALVHLDGSEPGCSPEMRATVDTDAGSLRADLLRYACFELGLSDPRRVRVVAAMATALRTDPALGAIWRERLLEPRMGTLRACFARAAARGEIDADLDVDSLVAVLPSMALFHSLFTDDPVDETFVARVIDNILLPSTSQGRTARSTTKGSPAP